MAERRKQAGRLFAAGKMIHAAIARELRVSRQVAVGGTRSGGAVVQVALRGADRTGRKPKLNVKHL